MESKLNGTIRVRKIAKNELRQNSMESTKTALKEHFILERIAEEGEIAEQPEDFEAEIKMIAAQSREPVRRVRARIEKQGLMDALRNQIVERKVIEKIVDVAKVTEEPVEKKSGEEEGEFAIYHSVLATKQDDAIPEAKYEDNTPAGAENQEKESEKD